MKKRSVISSILKSFLMVAIPYLRYSAMYRYTYVINISSSLWMRCYICYHICTYFIHILYICYHHFFFIVDTVFVCLSPHQYPCTYVFTTKVRTHSLILIQCLSLSIHIIIPVPVVFTTKVIVFTTQVYTCSSLEMSTRSNLSTSISL